MKSEKIISALIALVLSGIIALSCIACLTSSFALEAEDWTHIVWMTALVALVSTVCLSFRFGELVLTALVLLSVHLAVRHSDLILSAEKLLNHITTYYDAAYGCGVIRWSWEPLHRAAPDAALIALAALPAMATCWVVQRKQWFGFALLAAVPALALCCVVTDTQPDDTWLWLLLTAALLLAMTQRLRSISHRDANRLTALLLVPVILLTSVIFRFTSEEAGLSQAQTLQVKLLDVLSKWTGIEFPSQGNGPTIPGVDPSVSESLNLGHVGALSPTDQTVMTVSTKHYNGVLYLRGQAYDRYTGLRWDATKSNGDAGWPKSGVARTGTVTVKTDSPLPLKYFPYYTVFPDWGGQMQNGYHPNSDKDLEYTFAMYGHSNKVVITPLAENEIQKYLELPKDTLKAAQEILDEAGIDTALPISLLAIVIGSFVQNSATYSLATGAMPDGETDFALWFLEKSDTGYCVHFASAAAVLLRAAGIPARYVTGYMTQVVAGEECAVLDSQAHAWVEYYHPAQGWTVLESTPVSPDDPIIIPPTTDPTETTEPTESKEPTEFTDPTETTEPSESTEPTETTEPLGSTTPTETTEPTGFTRPVETTPGQTDVTEPVQQEQPNLRLNLKWIRGLLWVLAVWLLIAGQYRLRILWRRRQMGKGSPNQQALRRWRHVRRISRVSGYSAQAVLPLAEKAAFSQHELTAQELAQFDEWFRKANLALLEKPWMTQFILRLIFAVE